MSGNRRAFLEKTLAIAGAAALTACKSTPPEPIAPMSEPEPAPSTPEETDTLLDGLDPAHFILHNPKPLALKSLRHSIGMGHSPPRADCLSETICPIQTQRSSVQPLNGHSKSPEFKTPRRFTLSELKSFAYENICAVLQCSGNGRAF